MYQLSFGVYSNNRSTSAYRIEHGVRSIMKTSVVNILCPTNLLKYVLYMVILNDKEFFEKVYLSGTILRVLELFCAYRLSDIILHLDLQCHTPHVT